MMSRPACTLSRSQDEPGISASNVVEDCTWLLSKLRKNESTCDLPQLSRRCPMCHAECVLPKASCTLTRADYFVDQTGPWIPLRNCAETSSTTAGLCGMKIVVSFPFDIFSRESKYCVISNNSVTSFDVSSA